MPTPHCVPGQRERRVQQGAGCRGGCAEEKHEQLRREETHKGSHTQASERRKRRDRRSPPRSRRRGRPSGQLRVRGIPPPSGVPGGRAESSPDPSHFRRCLSRRQQLAGISASFPFGSGCTLCPLTAIKSPELARCPRVSRASIHSKPRSIFHSAPVCSRRRWPGPAQLTATKVPARDSKDRALLS